MTVNALIAALSALDPDIEVALDDSDYGLYTAVNVEVEERHRYPGGDDESWASHFPLGCTSCNVHHRPIERVVVIKTRYSA